MKELSIEQKAKRYDESLEQLKGLIESTREDKYAIVEEDIIDIFPELKEPEDEKVRRELISFLQLPHPQFVGERKQEKWIAWLEKQGQVKESHIFQHNNKTCKENDNSLTCEDEKIRKMCMRYLDWEYQHCSFTDDRKNIEKCIAWLEKQSKPKWSEEDEKIRKMIINHLTQERGSLSNKDTADAITWLEKQWSPLPMIVNEKEDFYVDGEFDSYSHIVGYISSAFMCYYDNNIPKGKMCLSNMECADIEKAFREQDWAKIERYIKKLGKAVKDMADSICWTPDEPIAKL